MSEIKRDLDRVMEYDPNVTITDDEIMERIEENDIDTPDESMINSEIEELESNIDKNVAIMDECISDSFYSIRDCIIENGMLLDGILPISSILENQNISNLSNYLNESVSDCINDMNDKFHYSYTIYTESVNDEIYDSSISLCESIMLECDAINQWLDINEDDLMNKSKIHGEKCPVDMNEFDLDAIISTNIDYNNAMKMVLGKNGFPDTNSTKEMRIILNKNALKNPADFRNKIRCDAIAANSHITPMYNKDLLLKTINDKYCGDKKIIYMTPANTSDIISFLRCGNSILNDITNDMNNVCVMKKFIVPYGKNSMANDYIRERARMGKHVQLGLIDSYKTKIMALQKMIKDYYNACKMLRYYQVNMSESVDEASMSYKGITLQS